MASELKFIRHAHTVWNGPPKRFQGQNDVPLSDKGLAQCKGLGSDFDWVERIVSSPALRVRQTVDAIFNESSKKPDITFDKNLWEINNGDYGGKFEHEVAEEYPLNYEKWLASPGEARPGGGETLLDLLTRAVLSIREIRKKPINGTLVATHGGIIRVLTLATTNRSLNDFHKLDVKNLDIFTLSNVQMDTLDDMEPKFNHIEQQSLART